MKILFATNSAERSSQKWLGEIERQFGKIPTVEVGTKPLSSYKADALVIDGDSFGNIASGGKNTFGTDFEQNLQTTIFQLPLKELLVGQSLVLPTKLKDFPFVVYTPVMRVPANISNLANIYLALKGVLIASLENNLKTLVCPPLGLQSESQVEAVDCAKQMYAAYKDFVDKFPVQVRSTQDAVRRNIELIGSMNIRGRK